MSGLNIANKNCVQIDNLSVYYGQTPAIAGVCLEKEHKEYLFIVYLPVDSYYIKKNGLKIRLKKLRLRIKVERQT